MSVEIKSTLQSTQFPPNFIVLFCFCFGLNYGAASDWGDQKCWTVRLQMMGRILIAEKVLWKWYGAEKEFKKGSEVRHRQESMSHIQGMVNDLIGYLKYNWIQRGEINSKGN